MTAKIPVALILLTAAMPVSRTAADEPKEADPFVGTYVRVSTRPDAPPRRLTVTKVGDHYRLDDVAPNVKKSYYPSYKFVRTGDGQLADERGVLGTLTLGRVAFADGTALPQPVLRLSFCYEQYYLVKERGPAPAASAARDPADHSVQKSKEPELFRAARALEEDPTDVNWDRLLGLVAGIRAEVEKKAGRLPYHLTTLATPETCRALPKAKPGLHSLWTGARYVAKLPPGPGGTYINTTAAVVNGHVAPALPRNVKLLTPADPAELWDGYISRSVVVVHGTVRTTSYIYDSIVIAAGPVTLKGYINNSLVISVGSQGDSRVDASDGYIANSLVVAEQVAGGYVQDSLIYGTVRSESLRGADARDHKDVSRIPWDVREPAPLPPAQPVKKGGRTR